MYITGITQISRKLLWLCSLLCLSWIGVRNIKTSFGEPSSANIRNLSNVFLRYRTISVRTWKSLQTSEIFHYSSVSHVSPTAVKQPRFSTLIPSDISFYSPSKRNTTEIFPAKTKAFNKGSLNTLVSVALIVPDNQNSTEMAQQELSSNKTRKNSFESSEYAGLILPSKGSNNKDSIHIENEKVSKFDKTFTGSSKTYFQPTQPDTDIRLTDTQFYDDKQNSSFDATKNPIIYVGETSTTKSPIYVGEKKLTVKKKYILPGPPQCLFGDSSCQGRCGYERQFGDKSTCFCDPECNAVFQDCCADFAKYCNVTLMLESVIESKFEERWTCTEVHGDEFPLWVIGHCQPTWDDADVLRRCTETNTDISELIPVIDQHNNTFLNRYCAICNNVTEFRQWEFDVFCEVIVPAGYTEAQWATFLDFFCLRDSFKLTQTWGRRYCVDLYANCTYWHNKDVVEGCLMGLTGLITDVRSLVHYRNWDCFSCNSKHFSRASCGPRPPIVIPNPKPGTPGGMSFSSIFRASSLQIPQSKCPQDQIHDETFRECKTLFPRNKLNFGKILKRYAVILEYKEHTNSCGISLSSGLESASLVRRLKDVFRKLLEISLVERDSKFTNFKIHSLGNVSFHVTFELLESSKETNLMGSSIGYDLRLQKLAFHSYLRKFSGGVCRYSMNTSIVREMLCGENDTFPLKEVELFANKSTFITKTGKLYSYQEYLVLKSKKRLALCKDYWPGNCSHYIEVKNESYWSIFENGSVHTNVTKASWLHYGQYTIVNGVLRFCSRHTEAVIGSTTSIHEAILSHATTVCLSVSITSLAVLLIVYSIFPALRNLPGKNLMLFSIILAFSQLLWLLQQYIASLSSTLCVGTTFALQYFLLASFSCSTSIAFHSLLTFHNIAKGSLTQSSSRKKFYFYALYSLGFPLVLLLTCWFLYSHNILTIVHYHPACWFKDDLSVYIAFYIPAFTMLFLNFILLLKTMILLRDCSNERRNLAGRNGAPTRIQIGIYFRMSTIMGATWLFGVFILLFPNTIVFEYLFVFINGLQGLYIALAFLFTDNVKKMIRSRRCDRGTTSRNTSRSMPSTTM